MRQVSISKTTTDLKTLDIRDRIVTAFTVGAEGIEQVTLKDEPIPATVSVMDPETGDAVTLESDPLRWADLLPSAYRSGDYHVAVDVVDEDDMPVVAASGDSEDIPSLLEFA